VNEQPSVRKHKPMPQLEDFPHRITDNIRFGDLDPQGHVNQAVYLTYFETGRVAMFRLPDLGIGVPGLTYVMARMEVDYVKELHWPGSITIGTGVAEFGRSSFTTAYAAPPASRRWCAWTSPHANRRGCRTSPSRA
jgi:acyl-CoA thioester hydrolase